MHLEILKLSFNKIIEKSASDYLSTFKPLKFYYTHVVQKKLSIQEFVWKQNFKIFISFSAA